MLFDGTSDLGASLGGLILKKWAVFHTQPFREFLAEEQLLNQGFEVFLPKHEVTVRHARKLYDRLKPFFPGYGFVSIEEHTRWRSINGTLGVRYLISQHEKPAFLPTGFVEALQHLLDPSVGPKMMTAFAKGDRVRIVKGPFSGLVGDLTRVDERGRVTLLVSLLSNSVPIKTDVRSVSYA